MKVSMQLYDEMKHMYSNGGLPECAVDFVDKDYVFPDHLHVWLRADPSIQEVHRLLMPAVKSQVGQQATEPVAGDDEKIWEAIQVDDDDDDELDDLLQLKEMVTKSNKIRTVLQEADTEKKNAGTTFSSNISASSLNTVDLGG